MKKIRLKTRFTSDTRLARSDGFSLVEVLVTAVVMSVGLLGIAGLQLTSLKNNDSAFIRSQGTIFSYNLIDYMRANRQSAIAGDYNISLSALSDLSAPSGTPTIADSDRYSWFQQLDANLPNAKAAINCDANAVCVVKVEWNDSHAEGSTSTKDVVLTAQL
ncbi:MAG: type IV pilus modification protein PilV [Gammaproteobacteria bacterium]|nr:type IV pilus modification protein PilV [Gammaproteobacteria bacterium]